MTTITVDDLSTLEQYEQARFGQRKRAIALRKLRTIRAGERVSLVFENRETILFEIHEAMRVEGITSRDTLQAECDVYADLLPSSSQLSATLQIFTSPNGGARAELEQLSGIVDHLSLVVDREAIGAQAEPGVVTAPVMHVRFLLDEAQRMRFCDLQRPVSIRLTHPNCQGEQEMTVETRHLIAKDLQ